MKAKQVLRKQMTGLLHTLPAAELAAGSSVICRNLLKTVQYKTAQRIIAFLNMADEVCLDPFIEAALAAGKEIYVPRCLENRRMAAVRLCNIKDTVPDICGIRTARPGAPVCAPQDLDLIIVSGLAFDRAGHRLGRGAGFYDRFLTDLGNAAIMAVAFSGQVLPQVPAEGHDIGIPVILTEKEYIECT